MWACCSYESLGHWKAAPRSILPTAASTVPVLHLAPDRSSSCAVLEEGVNDSEAHPLLPLQAIPLPGGIFRTFQGASFNVGVTGFLAAFIWGSPLRGVGTGFLQAAPPCGALCSGPLPVLLPQRHGAKEMSPPGAHAHHSRQFCSIEM